MRAAIIGFVAFTASCGPTIARRPLSLDVDGVSGRSERLVVKIFDKARGVVCSELTLMTAQALVADFEQVWTRSEMSDRKLGFDDVDLDAMTIVVYTEDAAARVIQMGCTQLDYEGIESPDRTIDLSRPISGIAPTLPVRPFARSLERPSVRIVGPCPRDSDPSCSIVSWAEGEWRRPLSPIATVSRTNVLS